MRVIELSNHPGDMLADVSLRRRAAESRAQNRYEDALIQYRARVQTIRVKRDRARRNHQWWTWLRLAFAVRAEKRRVPRLAVPDLADAGTDAEEKIRAGIAGEQLVAAELGRVLDDGWTLLRGYRNRRGEIDHVLLGPRGLFAIEAKNINATVHIDGDRWRADKYDNYGNLVEQRLIADRKGRSPSEQLNEPADELERFLHQRGQPVTVQRMVVLTHRRSRLGPRRNATVHVGTSTGDVLALVRASAGELGERRRAEVGRLPSGDVTGMYSCGPTVYAYQHLGNISRGA
jgi:hypothetical protein